MVKELVDIFHKHLNLSLPKVPLVDEFMIQILLLLLGEYGSPDQVFQDFAMLLLSSVHDIAHLLNILVVLVKFGTDRLSLSGHILHECSNIRGSTGHFFQLSFQVVCLLLSF